MNLLSDLEFEVIMDAAKRTHMMSVERRRLLLDGLPPDYIGRLASSSSPYDQLRSDLLEPLYRWSTTIPAQFEGILDHGC